MIAFRVHGRLVAGAAEYRRACTQPYTCRKGKVSSLQADPKKGRGCNCQDPRNCQSCEWGAQGSKCTRCRNGLYLHNGACVESCPTGAVSSGAGR